MPVPLLLTAGQTSDYTGTKHPVPICPLRRLAFGLPEPQQGREEVAPSLAELFVELPRAMPGGLKSWLRRMMPGSSSMG